MLTAFLAGHVTKTAKCRSRSSPGGKFVEVLTAGPAESPSTQGTGPTTGTEEMLAEVLAEVVGIEQVPVDSHFFDDLGADSLVMARFCARVRKRADLPSVSMKDVYRHPTIRSLATALADAARPPSRVEPSVPAPAEVRRHRPARREYVLCGTLQLLFFLGYSYLAAFVVVRGIRVDLRRLRSGRHLPAVGRCSAARASSACAPFRSWRSGCSSAGGSPSRSASGAWRTSASGSSRR